MLVNRKKSLNLVLGAFLIAFFLWPFFPALAQDANLNLGINYATATLLTTVDIRIVIARIIQVALGLLGTLAVVIIVYAGYVWMTSLGDEDRIRQAKQTLINAAIGLAIILSAFSIATFVIEKLKLATLGGGYESAAPETFSMSGTLMAGIIESHYPTRNQKDVPRNTTIIVTFREPIDETSIIKNYTNPNTNTLDDLVDTDKVKIYDIEKKTEIIGDILVTPTADHKTFVFMPVITSGGAAVNGCPPLEEDPSCVPYPKRAYLNKNTTYTVELTNLIKKANGESAFGALKGYEWSFTTSETVDVTPPRVSGVYPIWATTEHKNVVIQINFNEAINPVTIPMSKDATNPLITVNVVKSDGTTSVLLVTGGFYVTNSYRTLEFMPDPSYCSDCTTDCVNGVKADTTYQKNSCGDDIYCLPASINVTNGDKIRVLLKAAKTINSVDATAEMPYTGLVDAAGNSFDGNADGVADGPVSNFDPEKEANKTYTGNRSTWPGDNYTWSFKTDNVLEKTPPTITIIKPLICDYGVKTTPEATFDATFSRVMKVSSFLIGGTGASMFLNSDPASGLKKVDGTTEVAYWMGAEMGSYVVKENGIDVTYYRTIIKYNHDAWTEPKDLNPAVDVVEYNPWFNSNVKDIYQNCFYPAVGPTDSGCTMTISGD